MVWPGRTSGRGIVLWPGIALRAEQRPGRGANHDTLILPHRPSCTVSQQRARILTNNATDTFSIGMPLVTLLCRFDVLDPVYILQFDSLEILSFLADACEMDRNGSVNPVWVSHRPPPCAMSLPGWARDSMVGCSLLNQLAFGLVGNVRARQKDGSRRRDFYSPYFLEGPTWPWSERSGQGKRMGLGDWTFFFSFIF